MVPPRRPLSFFSCGALIALAIVLPACNRAPAEPDGPASTAEATVVPPLLWDSPGSWTKLPAPPSGPKKATYRIDKTGNDKEEAEMNVFFYGTGAKGDPPQNFKEWFDQFDG